MSISLFVASLQIEDLEAGIHFYRDLLGIPLLPHHAGRPHFDLGSCYLVLLRGKSSLQPAAERFPCLAFTVDDLDTRLEKLRLHGVPLPWGVEQDSGSRWVMFHDPGGNLVELVEFNSHRQ
jgi:catechol-2,3-dioxygenase